VNVGGKNKIAGLFFLIKCIGISNYSSSPLMGRFGGGERKKDAHPPFVPPVKGGIISI